MAFLLVVLICGVHCVVIARNGGLAQCRPVVVIAAINLLRVAPMGAATLFTDQFIDPHVFSMIGRARFDAVFSEYLLIELVGSTAFLAIVRPLQWPSGARRIDLTMKTAWALALLGVVLLAINIHYAGGLTEYLESFHRRLSVFRKVRTIQIPAYFLYSVSLAIAMRHYIATRGVRHLVACLVILLTGLVVSAYSGGRRDGMLLVIASIVLWTTYGGRRITIRASWIAGVAAVFFLYMNGLTTLRREGGMKLLLNRPLDFIGESLANVVQPFVTISYLSTYLLIMGTFSEYRGGNWGLGIIEGVPMSMVPRVINPAKPPVDEGVYIYNLYLGWRGVPPVSMLTLQHSSMPPETIGNGYLLGGLIGAIGSYCLKGLLLRLYWIMNAKLYAPFSIVSAGFAAYTLEVSPLRLLQVGMVFVPCLVFSGLASLLVKRRRRQRAGPVEGPARLTYEGA